MRRLQTSSPVACILLRHILQGDDDSKDNKLKEIPPEYSSVQIQPLA